MKIDESYIKDNTFANESPVGVLSATAMNKINTELLSKNNPNKAKRLVKILKKQKKIIWKYT